MIIDPWALVVVASAWALAAVGVAWLWARSVGRLTHEGDLQAEVKRLRNQLQQTELDLIGEASKRDDAERALEASVSTQVDEWGDPR